MSGRVNVFALKQFIIFCFCCCCGRNTERKLQKLCFLGQQQVVDTVVVVGAHLNCFEIVSIFLR